jgi:predicted TIM-barrel fold metal-dependent hydrolase
MSDMSDSTATDWIISVDDHVIEHPNVWQDRIPKRYQEAAPHIVTDDLGEAWVYEGVRKPTEGLAAAAGRDKTEFTVKPLTYAEMRPGCYDPKARIDDMNLDGILASLCFPAFPRFCGQVFLEAKDKELALLCVQAYNDWMIDEWCGSAPGRFIPLTLIPLWDPELAACEIQRCAGNGARAFAFSENPPALGLPSLYDKGGYWDPVMSAADETGMVVCTHIGSSSQLPKTAPDMPLIVSIVLTPLNAMNNLVDWLFCGYLSRHSNLKLALSEGGIGWIPATLERAAYTLDRHRYWAATGDFNLAGEEGSGAITQEALDMDPIQVFRDHIYGCFIDDVFGAENIDAIGVNNVMVESDYPHTDSTWPHTQETIRKRLAGRSRDDVFKILQGNARRVFDFTPADPPSDAVR